MAAESHPSYPFRPRISLWVAAAWVAAGALFKLLAGSPNDMPPSVQEWPLLEPAWTFRLAIGVELCVVILALARPRVGWLALVLLFGFFDYLLLGLIRAGDASCGCFGSSIPIKPWLMMTIDSVLLLSLIVTRPWRGFRPRSLKPKAMAPYLASMLVAAALPWFLFHEAQVVTHTDEDTGEEITEVLGEWHPFDPSRWEGQMIHDTDLAQFIADEGGADLIPVPAQVIIYRLSCDHCRLHFEHLMQEPIVDRALVLIRVPEPSNPTDVVTGVKPPAAVELTLRELPRGYGITTPVILELDEFFVIGQVTEQQLEDY